MDGMFASLSNSHEDLIPNMVVSEGGAFGKEGVLEEVMRVTGLVSF